MVGRLRRLVELTAVVPNADTARPSLERCSGDEVDGVAFGAETVDRHQAVIRVAGLEGEQELDLVDAHRHADAVVLDVEDVEPELGQQRP